MAVIKDQRYNALKRLYQYHQDRLQYENILQMVLPRSLYQAFISNYNIDNFRRRKFFISILKAILFGFIFLIIFSWANVSDVQTLMFYHLFFLWVYVTSIAYQIYAK